VAFSKKIDDSDTLKVALQKFLTNVEKIEQEAVLSSKALSVAVEIQTFLQYPLAKSSFLQKTEIAEDKKNEIRQELEDFNTDFLEKKIANLKGLLEQTQGKDYVPQIEIFEKSLLEISTVTDPDFLTTGKKLMLLFEHLRAGNPAPKAANQEEKT
jgi:hypothetical protein